MLAIKFNQKKKKTSVDVLLFCSGPPTECFMFHSRAAVAKLHTADEVMLV